MHRTVSRALGLAILVTALFALSAPASSRAASFLADDASTLAEGETIEGNLYASGDTVTIEGEVTGDLICAGATILVSEKASIGGDIACAGRTIDIRGQVAGDVRAAGYLVRLGEGASVGGEWLAAAFAVELEPESEVADDLLAAGAQVRSAGTLKRDARIAAGGLEILGEVLGDVDASLGGAADAPQPMPWFQQGGDPVPVPVKGGLTLGSDARIGGDLSYSSPEASEVAEGAVRGEVTHELITPQASGAAGTAQPEQPWWQRWLLGSLRMAIALLLVGLVVLALAPRLTDGVRGLALGELIPNLGWGIGATFGAFVLMVALAVASALGLVFLSILTLGQLAKLAFALSFVCGTLLSFGLYLLGWGGQSLIARDLGDRLLRSSGGAARGVAGQALPLALGALLMALVLGLPIPVLGSLLRFLVLAWGLGLALLALRRTVTGGQASGDLGQAAGMS